VTTAGSEVSDLMSNAFLFFFDRNGFVPPLYFRADSTGEVYIYDTPPLSPQDGEWVCPVGAIAFLVGELNPDGLDWENWHISPVPAADRTSLHLRHYTDDESPEIVYEEDYELGGATTPP
jgi:hypothetical protein